MKKLLQKKPTIDQRFHQKKVILTGASSGIGAALAKRLAQCNAQVCLVARREDQLREVRQKCLEINSQFVSHIIVADVSEEQQCKQVINEAASKMEGIDTLMLNAGISCLVRLEDVPESDLNECERVMKINYFANVYLTYFALSWLKQSSDAMIVVTSSEAGIGWSPERSFYSASKHALRGFFNSLRCEVGKSIQITTVYPGFVMSEIHDKCYGSESISRQGKFMTAERCAELILHGAARGARDYCMTWLGTFAYRTTPLLGSIADKVAIRKAQSGIKRTKE